MPETLEEFANVLRAFRIKIPMATVSKTRFPSALCLTGGADIGDLFAAFGMADNSQHRIVRDGQVISPQFNLNTEKQLSTSMAGTKKA